MRTFVMIYSLVLTPGIVLSTNARSAAGDESAAPRIYGYVFRFREAELQTWNATHKPQADEAYSLLTWIPQKSGERTLKRLGESDFRERNGVIVTSWTFHSSEVDPDSIMRSLARHSGLEFVYIYGRTTTVEDFSTSFTHSRHQRRARGPSRVTDGSLAHLSALGKLKTLGLFDTGISDQGMRALKDLRRQDWLALANCRVEGNGLAHLAGLKRLQHLFLVRLPLKDRSLASLAGLGELKSLSLAHTPITDAGLRHILPLQQLSYLDLGQTGVSNEGLRSLSRLRRLETLRLGHCPIDNEGLGHLRSLQTLGSLNLYGTAIDDGAIQNLKRLKNLRSLDLRQTRVTSAAAADLSRSLSNAQILYDDGDE